MHFGELSEILAPTVPGLSKKDGGVYFLVDCGSSGDVLQLLRADESWASPASSILAWYFSWVGVYYCLVI